MSMSINLVKIKSKGINIEYHSSDINGICTMVWYFLKKQSIFYHWRDLFSTSKTKCRIKQKSLECTCNQVENTKNCEDCKHESNENMMVD